MSEAGSLSGTFRRSEVLAVVAGCATSALVFMLLFRLLPGFVAAMLGAAAGAALALTGLAWVARRGDIEDFRQMAALQTELTGLRENLAGLRRAEERHRELIELSTDFAWEQDEKFRFCYHSEGARRTGLIPELAHGKTRFELATEFIHPSAEEHRRALLAHEPFRDATYMRLREDGQRIYFLTSGNPVFNAQGEFRGYRGVGRNITREIEAERGLRESEARFRSLVKMTAHWYWVQDTDFRFTEITTARPGSDFDAADYIGRYRWDMPWAGVSEAQWEAHRATLAAHEAFYDFVLPREQRDGLRYISITGEPLFDARGEFIGYHGTARDVTDMFAMSTALHQAEDDLRAVGQATVAAIWDADEVRRVMRWSEGIKDIFGHDIAGRAVPNAWWREHVHADDRARIEASSKEAVAARQPRLALQYRFLRGDGSYAHVVDRGIIFYGEQGEVLRAIGGIVDITAQHEAEVAVRESEERFRAMAETAPVMVWVTNAAGAFTYVNTQLRKFFAAEGAAPVSDWSAVVLSSDRERFDAALHTAIEDRRPFRTECRVRRFDGAVRWLLLTGAVRENAQGEAQGLVGSGLDITERRHAEALLEIQNQTLERVAIGVDAGFTLRALAQSLEDEMHGAYCVLMRAERDGRTLAAVAAPTVPAGYRTLLNALPIGADEGCSGTAAFRREPVVTADIASDPLWEKYRAPALENGLHACTAVPLLGRKGQVLGTIAVYYATPRRPPTWDVMLLSHGSSLAALVLERDADEAAIQAAHANLEDRVRERTTELEAANKELEAFSYSVSHDLRSPLRTIDGFAQIVSHRYRDRLDAEAQSYLDRVRAGCQRMSELIDDLLRLSMVTRGGATRQEVDLSELARAVIDALQQAHPERRAAIGIDTGLRVRGDPKLLRVLLENLLGNAWKFTAKRPLAEIRFDSESVEGEMVYRVSDNGAGFDMKYADRLFSPFERLHHRDEFEGTGIGLATAQRVVRLHGGRIWAKSAPDKGTTLSFTLN